MPEEAVPEEADGEKNINEEQEEVKIIDLEQVDPIFYKPTKTKKSPPQQKEVVVEATTTFYESAFDGEATADFEFEDEEL